MSLVGLDMPPPAGQFAAIHLRAAAAAAGSVVCPEPLPRPVPLRQLAVQPWVVALVGVEEPPPAGQVPAIQVRAAESAADSVVYPDPLPLLPPLRQRADQLQVFTERVVNPPRPWFGFTSLGTLLVAGHWVLIMNWAAAMTNAKVVCGGASILVPLMQVTVEYHRVVGLVLEVPALGQFAVIHALAAFAAADRDAYPERLPRRVPMLQLAVQP